MINRIVIIFCVGLFTTTALAQDLDTRTIQIVSLEAAQEAQISVLEAPYQYVGSYPLTPLDFSKKDSNFWEPVDMTMAIAQTKKQSTRAYDIKALQTKTFGFTVTGNYGVTGPTTTKNIAYKDMSNYGIVGSCPPSGICWRCAPLRSNRFFR